VRDPKDLIPKKFLEFLYISFRYFTFQLAADLQGLSLLMYNLVRASVVQWTEQGTPKA
jgi:hypothetical protein